MSAPFHCTVLQKTAGRFSSVLQDLSGAIRTGCRPPYITCLYANNCWYGIADVQTIQLSWLHTVELYTGGSSHVEVNKSDTLRQDEKEPRIQSRICRYVFGYISFVLSTIAKVTTGIIKRCYFLGSLSEGRGFPLCSLIWQSAHSGICFRFIRTIILVK